MKSGTTQAKRWIRKRWRRGKRLALTTVVLLLVLGGWQGYRWLTDPIRVRAVAMAVLEQTLGGRIDLGRAELDVWRGRLRLTEVQVSSLDWPGPAGRVLQAPQVNIHYGLRSLWSVGEVVQSIEFPKPTDFYLTCSLSGQWNVQRLKSPEDRSSPQMPTHWPRIDLPTLRLHVGQTDSSGQGYSLIRRMDWSGRLFDPTPQPDGYRLEIQPLPSETGPSPVGSVTGQFDLAQLQATLMVRGLRLEPWMRIFLPSAMQERWDRLAPSGAVSLMSVSYDGRRSHGWDAQLALDHLSANLPWDGPNLRLNLASGRVLLTGWRLTLQEIHARLAEVGWRVNQASFDLNDPERSAWDLDFQAQGPLPSDAQLVARLPERVSLYLERFSPRGDFSLTVQARGQPDQPSTYRGHLKLIHVDGRDANFPYPFFDLNGSIDFDQDRLSLTDFQARGPTGARIYTQGWVEPMTDDAAASVMVVAEDLPLDEHLLGSLKPRARLLLESLMDHSALARLKQAGLVPGNLVLGGKVNVTIMDGRDMGLGKPFLTDIYLDTVNLTAMLSAWPTPVRLVGGQAHVHESRLMLHAVKLQGWAGGHGELSGTLEPMGENLNPDLRWWMTDWPLDALLMASLPAPVQQKLVRLGMSGRLAVQGQYQQPPTSSSQTPELRLTLDWSQGRLDPPGQTGSKLQVDGVGGSLEISPGQARIKRIQGLIGSSPVSLSGSLQWDDSLTLASHDIHFEAAGLEVDRQRIRSAGRLLADGELASNGWLIQADPAGTLDLSLDHWREPDRPDRYRLRLKPQAMSLTMNGQRLNYSDVTGQLLLDGAWATLEELSAKVDQARLSVSGRISLDDANRMDLTVDADSPALGREAGLLPPAVQVMLARHGWQGGYAASNIRVIQQPVGDGAQTSVLAEIDLKQAQADLGVQISEFDGRLSLRALSLPKAPLPQLDVAIHADRARVAGRWVSPLSGKLTSSPEGLAYDLTDLHGECYGGRIVGQGRLVPSPDQRVASGGGFSMELAIQDVALDPLLRPEHRRHAGNRVGSPESDGGRVWANLSLAGINNRIESRRGRGMFVIRQAKLYEVPLTMTLLQIINLTWPSSSSFDRASSDFVIDGDRLRLQDIRFEAASVQMIGSGWLNYVDQRTEMTFVTRNPQAPDLGPLGDALAMMKDELLTIRLTGTLSKPKATLEPLTGVRRSWQEIFSPSSP